MRSTTIRRWSWLHTWSSLICTLFLLMLALTGLPLIFHHELEHLLGEAPELRELPPDTPRLGLQQLVDAAERHRTGEVIQYIGYDKDEPNGIIAITAATAGTEPNASHTFMLDARSGEPVAMPAANGGVLMFILRLHVDMFAGLPGKLLLAFMGLLFILAIVSGVVLYAPFMRRLKFAEVRHERSTRTRWLDLHNLIGIVTLTWALVVGITGVISACADLLIEAWREETLGALMEPYSGAPLAAASPGRRPATHCRRGPARHAGGLHRLPRHALFHRTPLHRVHDRQHAPDRPSVDTGSDRRAAPGGDGHRRTPLVHGCAVDVAAPALRRLRRQADADSLGRARRADHHRAAQRPVSVVGTTARAAPFHAHGGKRMKWRESTFALPILIGLLCALGLFAALLGDGGWDALSWIGLGIPAVLGVWPLLRRVGARS